MGFNYKNKYDDLIPLSTSNHSRVAAVKTKVIILIVVSMKRTSLQKKLVCIQLFFLFAMTLNSRVAHGQKKEAVVTFHQYIAENVPEKKEIDVFLSDSTI